MAINRDDLIKRMRDYFPQESVVYTFSRHDEYTHVFRSYPASSWQEIEDVTRLAARTLGEKFDYKNGIYIPKEKSALYGGGADDYVVYELCDILYGLPGPSHLLGHRKI